MAVLEMLEMLEMFKMVKKRLMIMSVLTMARATARSGLMTRAPLSRACPCHGEGWLAPMAAASTRAAGPQMPVCVPQMPVCVPANTELPAPWWPWPRLEVGLNPCIPY
jgi:hypothetical protein